MVWDFAKAFGVRTFLGTMEKRAPRPVRLVKNFDLGIENAASLVINVGCITPAKDSCWISFRCPVKLST